MNILAIDTATPYGSICLAMEDELHTHHGNSSIQYSSRLYGWIEQLKRAFPRAFAALGGIVITGGPGTFTGLRIGLATAKGLAMAKGIPVAAFDTLEAIATACAGPGTTIRPCLNAGRGECCTALFERDADGELHRLEENTVISPRDFVERYRGDIPIAGSGIDVLKRLGSDEIKDLHLCEANMPLAPALIQLSKQTNAFASAQSGVYPQLNYLRAAVS